MVTRGVGGKASTAPKKSFGTYETIENGMRKRLNWRTSTVRPQRREDVPVRKVKSVCEAGKSRGLG